ncbi:hypothetical protein ACOME3_004801 [Neoechinorhynchus agilis]
MPWDELEANRVTFDSLVNDIWRNDECLLLESIEHGSSSSYALMAGTSTCDNPGFLLLRPTCNRNTFVPVDIPNLDYLHGEGNDRYEGLGTILDRIPSITNYDPLRT